MANNQDTAIDFIRSQLPEDIVVEKISAANIDSRIHFKQCSTKLKARSNNNRFIVKHQTIGIYCNGDKPWNIYISIKTKLLRKMLVSNTTIVRGEIVTAEKVQLIEKEIKNQKYLSDISNAVGYDHSPSPNH